MEDLSVFEDLIKSLEDSGIVFKGLANLSTVPEVSDERIFYIGTIPGVYVNFDSLKLDEKKTGILIYNPLETKWSIEQIDNSSLYPVDHYVTCSSSADSQIKRVEVENYSLKNAVLLHVKMDKQNSAYQVYFQVNDEETLPFYLNGQRVTRTHSWKKGDIVSIYYDGYTYQSWSEDYSKTNQEKPLTLAQIQAPHGIPYDGEKCLVYSKEYTTLEFTFDEFVGIDGWWVPISFNFNNPSRAFFIRRLESYDLMVENDFRIFGKGWDIMTKPNPPRGALFELRSNPSDIFENFANGQVVGEAEFVEDADAKFKGLLCANVGDYFLSSAEVDDTLTLYGMMGSDLDKSWTLGCWFKVSTLNRKTHICGGGSAHAGIDISLDENNDLVATFILTDGNFYTLKYEIQEELLIDTWYTLCFVCDYENVFDLLDGPSAILWFNDPLNFVSLALDGLCFALPLLGQDCLVAGAGMKVKTSGATATWWNNLRTDLFSQQAGQYDDWSVVSKITSENDNNSEEYLKLNSSSTVGDDKVYYFEAVVKSLPSGALVEIGLVPVGANQQDKWASSNGIVLMSNGQVFNCGSRVWFTGDDVALAVNDRIGFVVDVDGKVYIYKNGDMLPTGDLQFVSQSPLCPVFSANGAASSVEYHFGHFVSSPSGSEGWPSPGETSSQYFELESSGEITVRRFYGSDVTNSQIVNVVLAKVYCNATFVHVETKEKIVIPDIYVSIPKNPNFLTMKVPYEDILPAGVYDLVIESSLGKSNPVRVNILRPSHVVETVDLDFSDIGQLEDNFYATHKLWGGASGGCVKENIKWDEEGVHFIAHGDLYKGTVQGVNRDGTPKYHENEEDPDYGKPWVTRVGACIQTKNAMGFGRYEVNFKLVGENGNNFDVGVCAAIWTFFYNEEYVGSPFYDEIVAEGIINQGNEEDGFYVVRNHEIDIELPSHLDGGIRYQPTWDNMKCNSWIGELGSGDGTEGPGEEYISKLTPIGKYVNDGQWHNFRFDWYPNRIEFYVDDELKQVVTKFIPDIPGHMTIGLWFPSAPHPQYDWMVYRGWAGGAEIIDPIFNVTRQIADWDTQEMVMNHFKFTPFLEYENKVRDKGESFPFGSIRNLVGNQIEEPEGTKMSDNGPILPPVIDIDYFYKFDLTNVSLLVLDEEEINISEDGIFTYVSKKSALNYTASKTGYSNKSGVVSGILLRFSASAPTNYISLESE